MEQLENLPNELLAHVLSFIERKDWSSISCVNRRFYGLIQYPTRAQRLILWNLTILHGIPNPDRPTPYGVDETMYPTWRLSLDSDRSLEKLLNATAYISLLEIVFGEDESFSNHPAFQQMLGHLEQNELKPLFKVLRFSCASAIDIIRLCPLLRPLKQLILSDCKLNSEAFAALAALPNLDTLRLDKSKLALSFGSTVAFPPSLRILSGVGVFRELKQGLKGLPLLEILQFKDVDFAADEDFRELSEILSQKNVPKLKTLYFFSCKFSWASLDGASIFTKSLRKLQMCFSSMGKGADGEIMMFTRRLIREVIPSCRKLEMVLYPRLMRSFYDHLLPYLVRNGITLHMGCYYSKFDWDGISIPAPKCLGEVLKHLSYNFTDYQPGSWDARPDPRLADRNNAQNELDALLCNLTELRVLKSIYLSTRMLPDNLLNSPQLPLAALGQIPLPKLKFLRLRSNLYSADLADGLLSFLGGLEAPKKLKISIEPLHRDQTPFHIPKIEKWKCHEVAKQSHPEHKRVILWTKDNYVIIKNYYDCVEGKVPLLDASLKPFDSIEE